MSPTRKNEDDDGDGDSSGSESGSGHSSRASSPAATSVTNRSRSRSGSGSKSRSRSGSRSKSGSPHSRRSHSRSSGSGASDSGESHRSRSKSKSKSKSRSRSPVSVKSGSRSKSKSKSRSKSRSKSKSKSRSRSGSRSISRSRSRSRSASVGSNKSSSDGSDHKSAKSASPQSQGSKSPVTTITEASSFKADSDGSGTDEDTIKPKKLSVKPEATADATQLFGDADDISSGSSDSESENKATKARSDKKKRDDIDPMDVDDNDDAEKGSDAGSVAAGSDHEIEEPPPETRIDVEIPKITTDLGKGIHFVKLPNFLSVETRPFDANTYEDEIDDEETLDEEGRARLKLKVENTVRWRERFNEKNVFVKESNSRFVRWSDGSLSLHLGGEIFNVYKQPLQGDHNHLFIRQGTGLQGQAVFRTKLTFRPHSTDSFTHRKMTLSLADRSQKTSGIKVISTVGNDPEARRDEMIKKEEDKLRASMRRENKQRRVRERVTSRSGGGGLTANYLEQDLDDDDDENAISLSAIKNRYKKGGSGKSGKLRTNIYSSEEDDEAIEDDGSDIETKARKPDKAKRLLDSDDEDMDDEKAEGSSKAVISDHSDEEGKGDASKVDDSE